MIGIPVQLSIPLPLRSGKVVPNRIVKAAMEEQLAGDGQVPSDDLIRLYARWGLGGAGMLITGHVMVDGRAVAQPGDVVLEVGQPLERFAAWAAAARGGGSLVLMQINHPGRVVMRDLSDHTVAPSAVRIEIGRLSRFYPEPRAMTEVQIYESIARFAQTAALAERAGFDGVQIHAAHGYLVSQFLSPLVNQRDDAWGGSLQQRARILLEIVRAVRAATRPDFVVGVKLNSADFQRGGFDEGDAEEVIDALSREAVDLVELSGGSVESLATSGITADGRTLAREAYFIDIASRLARQAPLPLMLTGGIRRRAIALDVLAAGVELVGVASAFALNPTLASDWLGGDERESLPPTSRCRAKMLRSTIVQAATTDRIRRLAGGCHAGNSRATPLALARDQFRRTRQLRRYRRWAARPGSPTDLTTYKDVPSVRPTSE